MRCPLPALILLLLATAASPAAHADPGGPGDDIRVRNLLAFAKLYGYVRFFHPSDEAALVDWNRLAVHGAAVVVDAPTPVHLQIGLEEVFGPLAPTMTITAGPPGEAAPLPGADAPDGLRLVAWQHYGVHLTDRSQLYKSRRVNRDENGWPLFPQLPRIGEATEADLGRGLRCRVPLALYADATGTLSGSVVAADELARLTTRLAAMPTPFSPRDPAVRVAAVIVAWNVFQHFYPYFDVVDADWDTALDEALAAALDDPDRVALFDTLNRLVAHLDDGHAVVSCNACPPRSCPPLRLERIESRIVVTAVAPGCGVEVGDVLRTIDGRPAVDELARQAELVSGSPQLREHRALNMFGAGETGSVAWLELERDGEELTVRVTRSEPANLFFRRSEFDHPGLEELDDGVLYVNLRTIDGPTLEANMDRLAAAPGVVLDFRWGASADRAAGMFNLLPHLIREPVRSARWNVPQTIYPDQRDTQFKESGWPMKPKTPTWQGRIAIIVSPPVVSAGETIMGIVEAFNVAEIVGHPTAGCNGNANFITPPGGFNIMWTGMKVLKHDGSQHHLVGIRPKHPVRRTIAAVREGRDEMLERAIDIVIR